VCFFGSSVALRLYRLREHIFFGNGTSSDLSTERMFWLGIHHAFQFERNGHPLYIKEERNSHPLTLSDVTGGAVGSPTLLLRFSAA
jgi:hypothetical protein